MEQLDRGPKRENERIIFHVKRKRSHLAVDLDGGKMVAEQKQFILWLAVDKEDRSNREL